MLVERFYILNCKEIENLIPPEILKEMIIGGVEATSKSIDLVDYSKYSTSEEGLGKYLDDLLGKGEFALEETGTLKKGVNFCEEAFDDAIRSSVTTNACSY